jgi:hypothetical protein
LKNDNYFSKGVETNYEFTPKRSNETRILFLLLLFNERRLTSASAAAIRSSSDMVVVDKESSLLVVCSFLDFLSGLCGLDFPPKSAEQKSKTAGQAQWQ